MFQNGCFRFPLPVIIKQKKERSVQITWPSLPMLFHATFPSSVSISGSPFFCSWGTCQSARGCPGSKTPSNSLHLLTGFLGPIATRLKPCPACPCCGQNFCWRSEPRCGVRCWFCSPTHRNGVNRQYFNGGKDGLGWSISTCLWDWLLSRAKDALEGSLPSKPLLLVWKGKVQQVQLHSVLSAKWCLYLFFCTWFECSRALSKEDGDRGIFMLFILTFLFILNV